MAERGSPPSGRLLLAFTALVAMVWLVMAAVRLWAPIGEDRDADPAARRIVADRGAPESGPANADLTLVVFTDYRCPACRRADPAMRAAVAADGRVRVSYRDWPIFGPVSEHAALIALAARPQGIYPPLHARLMAEPRPLTDATLRADVEAVGGDWAAVQRTLATDEGRLRARLDANALDAARLRLPGTPAYLAGSILLVGAGDERTFRRLFARARSVRQPPRSASTPAPSSNSSLASIPSPARRRSAT